MRRGLVRSRHEAHLLIKEGRVAVAGITRTKPASTVLPSAAIEIESGPRFVSRGGFKLEAALAHFGLEVKGRRVLDVGAGAGGFTDCLLQRGAASVVAVDVGSGQFSPDLAAHPSVTLHEQTDVRSLPEERFAVVVVDLSFISLCAVASKLTDLLESDGDLVALVKPQFEAGRGRVGKGVVNAPETRSAQVTAVRDCLGAAGLDTVGWFDSPLRGEHGNQETFLWVRNKT